MDPRMIGTWLVEGQTSQAGDPADGQTIWRADRATAYDRRGWDHMAYTFRADGTGRIEIRIPAAPHEWPFAWRMTNGILEVSGPGTPASSVRIWFLSDDRVLMRYLSVLPSVLLVREQAQEAEPDAAPDRR